MSKLFDMKGRPIPIDGDGGPPHDSDMEKRVATLEADMKSLVKDVAEIKGRISQMPTTFQMLSWYVGVAMALTGLVFAIARLTA